MHTFHSSAPASTFRLLAVSFFCLLCRKTGSCNRSWLFIVCSIPPFHIGPSDSSTTNTLDVWWCTPLARISCTDMHDISPVLWSINLHILHFLHPQNISMYFAQNSVGRFDIREQALGHQVISTFHYFQQLYCTITSPKIYICHFDMPFIFKGA